MDAHERHSEVGGRNVRGLWRGVIQAYDYLDCPHSRTVSSLIARQAPSALGPLSGVQALMVPRTPAPPVAAGPVCGSSPDHVFVDTSRVSIASTSNVPSAPPSD